MYITVGHRRIFLQNSLREVTMVALNVTAMLVLMVVIALIFFIYLGVVDNSFYLMLKSFFGYTGG